MRSGQHGLMSSKRLEVLMPRMHNLQSNRVRVEVEGGERRGGSRRGDGRAGERGREIENLSSPPWEGRERERN